MDRPIPPTIFSPKRRLATRRRFRARRRGPDSPSYIIADMVDDVMERLAFLRHTPRRALVIGDWSCTLPGLLEARGAEVLQADPCGAFDQIALDEEQPFPETGFDFIASLGTLDTVNDLPGALIHIRNALAPGGLAIASFPGAGSLPALRAAMLAADGERPAPRLHPMVDVRAGGQLLQRAGWADPVVDSRTLEVRFSSLDRLVADLREQGLTNVLARPGPSLTRSQHSVVKEQFRSGTVERFEILTLSGWKR
jgi:SAM-dependent methyltransferase